MFKMRFGRREDRWKVQAPCYIHCGWSWPNFQHCRMVALSVVLSPTSPKLCMKHCVHLRCTHRNLCLFLFVFTENTFQGSCCTIRYRWSHFSKFQKREFQGESQWKSHNFNVSRPPLPLYEIFCVQGTMQPFFCSMGFRFSVASSTSYYVSLQDHWGGGYCVDSPWWCSSQASGNA